MKYTPLMLDLSSSPPQRDPFWKQQEAKDIVEGLLKNDIIAPSSSPWASPVVLVKKDGSTRMFVDYRHLNAISVPDMYPLPHIDDSLDALGGGELNSLVH